MLGLMKLHRKGHLKMQKEKGIANYRIHHCKGWFYFEKGRVSSNWRKKIRMAKDGRVPNIRRISWSLKQ